MTQTFQSRVNWWKVKKWKVISLLFGFCWQMGLSALAQLMGKQECSCFIHYWGKSSLRVSPPWKIAFYLREKCQSFKAWGSLVSFYFRMCQLDTFCSITHTWESQVGCLPISIKQDDFRLQVPMVSHQIVHLVTWDEGVDLGAGIADFTAWTHIVAETIFSLLSWTLLKCTRTETIKWA